MSRSITLFLCGDVMTGRGIDQILPHPVSPRLFEPYMHSACGYVALAEERSGPIPRPVDFAYVWGDALTELARVRPHARIVNLETAVTVSEDAWPRKGIHYRMHPTNVSCLTAAGIDCCVLANNHVLDWGYRGLAETLVTLHGAGIRTAGAGEDARAASDAAVTYADGGRVLVLALGAASSGVPASWAAGAAQPGVNYLNELSQETVAAIGRQVAAIKRPGDVVVVSIHWGENWGFEISAEERAFAHALIDGARVDMIHGHSSHHVKGIEVYRDRPILYGCGDFLNDYEGIAGYEEYRGELALMYFPRVDPASGRLLELRLVPTRTRRFRVERAPAGDRGWLEQTLNREGRHLGTRVQSLPDRSFSLTWS